MKINIIFYKKCVIILVCVILVILRFVIESIV